MRKQLWPLAALPLTAVAPAMAYDVQFDQHTDWAYTDSSTPEALHYRPWHFQVGAGPTLTRGQAGHDLESGWNAGGGVTWNPSRYVPFGIRADASYSKFGVRQSLLDQTSTQLGTTVDSGMVAQWGGDLDGEIDIPLSPVARFYLLGGGGWYKTQSTYRQWQVNSATMCTWWGCQVGYVQTEAVVSRTTTPSWQFARNLGIGVEWGVGPGTSFFVEARYMRLGHHSAGQDFIPVRFGVRF
jgi:hypothetical protein